MINKKKIIGKKASGHIEVVLSFIIFISFVIFLFSVFPVYQIKKSEIGLDSAERGILNFTSAKVNYFAIRFESSSRNKPCFFFPSKDILSKLIARNSSGGRVNAWEKNNQWYVHDAGGIWSNSEIFYGFYYSSEFSEEEYGAPSSLNIGEDCNALNTDGNLGYKVGLVREDYMMSYNKTVNLIDKYNMHYEEIRGNFSIPAGENFEFSVVDLKGNIMLNASRNKPERTTVLSRNTPIQMVYKNGTYWFGMLNVRTW